METIIRVVLGATLLPVLLLGLRIARGQAGRGQFTTAHGLALMRSILVALWVGASIWYVAAEATMPAALQIEPGVAMRAIGLVLFIQAMLFRIWAQRTLGKMWSADISVRPDHQIIERGPYDKFAHPIYLAYWPAGIGLLCATGNLLISGLALVYALVSYLRISAEEELLQQHFGPPYNHYLQTTRVRRALVGAAIVVVGLVLLNLFGMSWEVFYLLH